MPHTSGAEPGMPPAETPTSVTPSARTDLRQEQARAYRSAGRRRGYLQLGVASATIVVYALAASAVVRHLPHPVALQAALVALIGGCAVGLTTIGFGVAAYAAARRYGLSRQTLGGYLADTAKGAVLGGVLSAAAAAGVIAVQRDVPAAWPVLAWLVMQALALVMTLLLPVLILPLFLRSERLVDGPLYDMTAQLAADSSLPVRDVRLVRLSAKTSAANAAVVGFGPTRRILLGDTLTEQSDLAETRAVLAHEFAHHKNFDIWRGLIIGAATSLVAWLGAAYLVSRLPSALAHHGRGDPASLPALAACYAACSAPLGLVSAWHSRRAERAADRFACSVASPAAYATAMEKLVASNLAELWPPRLDRILASHPPPRERIAAARARRSVPGSL